MRRYFYNKKQFKILTLLPTIICAYFLFIGFVQAIETKKATLYFDLGSEDGWVPFRTGDMEGEQGILADLVELLEASSKINFESVHLPSRRAERALSDGLVDFDFICKEWLPNGDIGDNFVVSDALFEVKEYVITLKENRGLYSNLDDFYGKDIGTIGGYFYFDESHFNRVDFLDENKLMKGLKHRRFEAIILEGEKAKHWSKINEIEIAFAALHSEGGLRIRLNKRNSKLIDEINALIARIKESGELDKILANHGLQKGDY
jgi:hypothetical protein